MWWEGHETRNWVWLPAPRQQARKWGSGPTTSWTLPTTCEENSKSHIRSQPCSHLVFSEHTLFQLTCATLVIHENCEIINCWFKFLHLQQIVISEFCFLDLFFASFASTTLSLLLEFYNVLKVSIPSLPTLFFFKVALGFLGSVYFHRHFGTSLLISIEKILLGFWIVLNPLMNLGRTDI